MIGIVMCLTTLIETPNFNKRYKMLFRENNFHVDPKMMYTLCQLLFFLSEGGRVAPLRSNYNMITTPVK